MKFMYIQLWGIKHTSKFMRMYSYMYMQEMSMHCYWNLTKNDIKSWRRHTSFPPHHLLTAGFILGVYYTIRFTVRNVMSCLHISKHQGGNAQNIKTKMIL